MPWVGVGEIKPHTDHELMEHTSRNGDGSLSSVFKASDLPQWGNRTTHLSPVLEGVNQTTKTAGHLCEHIPFWLCLSVSLSVYWIHPQPICLASWSPHFFFSLKCHIPQGLTWLLFSTPSVPLTGLSHPQSFQYGCGFQIHGLVLTLVSSSRFVPSSSQTPPLG